MTDEMDSLPEGDAPPLDEERVRELAEDLLEDRIAATRVSVEDWKLENWIERAKNEVYRDSLGRLAVLFAGILAILVLAAGHLMGALEARLERRAVSAVLASSELGAVLEQVAVDAERKGAAALDPNALPSGVPVGTILAYAGEPDVKALYAQGYMLCNGQRLIAGTRGWTPEEFNALYAAVGTSWGGGRTGAGRRYLHLPDLRGLFLRGVDGGAGKDLEAARQGTNGKDLRVAMYEGGNTGDAVGTYQPDTVGRPKGFVRPGKILFYACTQDPSPEVECPPLSLHAPRWFQNQEDEKWMNPPRGKLVDTRPKNAAVHWIVRVK